MVMPGCRVTMPGSMEAKFPSEYSETAQKIETATNSIENRLTVLERLIGFLERGELTEELLEYLPTVAKLRQDNQKLRYRCRILEDAVKRGGRSPAKAAEATTTGKDKMCDEMPSDTTLLRKMKNVFERTIRTAFPETLELPVLLADAGKPQFGDYQCNSAMAISQILGKSGQPVKPRDVAQKILDNIPSCALIEKVEIAGPGFINIHLSRGTLSEMLKRVLLNGVAPPAVAPKRIVVDFSAPNIAKEMHVGHLRSTIIGDCLARMLEFVGMDVVRISHVGDWGTQFGMLIAHLQDKFPNYLHETPPLPQLQTFYKESKSRFDSDEDFKRRAYECVVKLQSYEPDSVKAWQLICDASRKDFERIYERLDIKIVERGESFYQGLMIKVVKELDDKGKLVEDEGRKVLFASGHSVPLTVVKSDGGYTYDTSDLAALQQRLRDERADWILYVVDQGQNSHLETIYSAGRDLAWYQQEKTRVEHVGFGVVLGEDKKKLKTRSGDTVRLTDLLDEGMKRALETLEQKGRHEVLSAEELKMAQEAVAYGCIKYADLSHNRLQDYVFSFDRMLDDRGNTAVYLLYAYTRIRSIARTANLSREEVVEWAARSVIPLTHPAELKLAKVILKFPDIILECLDRLLPHILCDYLYDVACAFTDFYGDCYCIEKDADDTIKAIHYHRLALCEVTADTLAAGFAMIGLRPVQRM